MLGGGGIKSSMSHFSVTVTGEINDRKTFKVVTSTLPLRTLGSVASLLAATLYQGNH
jgi:hypothetical protein